jgi:hypothetical protein
LTDILIALRLLHQPLNLLGHIQNFRIVEIPAVQLLLNPIQCVLRLLINSLRKFVVHLEKPDWCGFGLLFLLHFGLVFELFIGEAFHHAHNHLLVFGFLLWERVLLLAIFVGDGVLVFGCVLGVEAPTDNGIV